MDFLLYLLNKITPVPSSLECDLRNLLFRKTMPKGALILMEGEICDNIYFLRKGRARCFKYTRDGIESFQGYRTSGDLIIPLQHALDRRPSNYNVLASEDCEYWCMQGRDFQRTRRLFPEWKVYQDYLEEKCRQQQEQDFLARII
jgi:CRP-like cAMP-binding protein